MSRASHKTSWWAYERKARIVQKAFKWHSVSPELSPSNSPTCEPIRSLLWSYLLPRRRPDKFTLHEAAKQFRWRMVRSSLMTRLKKHVTTVWASERGGGGGEIEWIQLHSHNKQLEGKYYAARLMLQINRAENSFARTNPRREREGKTFILRPCSPLSRRNVFIHFILGTVHPLPLPRDALTHALSRAVRSWRHGIKDHLTSCSSKHSSDRQRRRAPSVQVLYRGNNVCCVTNMHCAI